MATTSETRDIVPDLSLFHKLGARSRALPMVVAELVDNSLDSWNELPKSEKKGEKLTIKISASEGKNSARFLVEDNAGGMTQDELVSALTVAKSHKTGNPDLIGNFGFGLKSAAMYIGSEFKIFTRSYKEPNFVNHVSFDKEKFLANKQWKLKFVQMSVKEAEKLLVFFPAGHGTIIDIKNERYRSANKKGIVRKLRRTFAPRIQKDVRLKAKFEEYKADMDIVLNMGVKDERIIAAGPFYTYWNNSVIKAEKMAKDRLSALKKSSSKEEQRENLKFAKSTDYLRGDFNEDESVKREDTDPTVIPQAIKWMEKTIPGLIDIPETTIKDPEGGKSRSVWGRIGILDRGMAYNNEFGFDLIKNGRVIEEFVLDKHDRDNQIGLVSSNHNARIVGQLFLDDWETDHQKLSFRKDSGQWEALAKFVSENIKKHSLLSVSSNLQHPGELLKELVGVVDDNSPETITEEKFEDDAPGLQKVLQKAVRSSAFKAALKSAEKSKKSPGSSSKPSSQGKAESGGSGSKKKVEPKQSTSALVSVTPQIDLVRRGDRAAMVQSKLRTERGKSIFEIALNRDHPFLSKRESSELKAIGEFLALDAYATFVLSNKDELNHEDFLSFRDTLLREMRPKK